MTQSLRTVIFMLGCVVAAVILTGERRAWWTLNSPLDWLLPVGIMAAGIVFWAVGWNRGARS